MDAERPIISYETERLVLKPTTVEDAAFILALMNTPLWIQNIGQRNVHTVADAEQYINDKMMTQYQKLGFGNHTVILKDTGAKMGTCGIYARPDQEDVDIGFAMLPQYMGKGYSYEAASKMMQLAKDKFEIKKIAAVTLKDNIPSQKLIQKLGLTYEGEVKLEGDGEVLMKFSTVIK